MKNILRLQMGFGLLFLAAIAGAQQLPSDPLSGREVFEKQGCMNCHAVNGTGGTTGPDFGKQTFVGNDYDLLSRMWNHSQKMLLVMATTKTERPRFTGKDLRNLGDFLYFVRYLGQPGNPAKGKKLFSYKGCISCHSIGKAVTGKISLDSMKIFVSPIELAQVMWNHASEMQIRGKKKNVKLPTFSDDEFSDLTAYIRQASSLKTDEEIYSYPGDPAHGEQVFVEKGCYYCHVEKPVGPKLSEIKMDQSVTSIAGIMWNHSAKMGDAMKATGKPFPVFTDGEMADVISYLYFENSPKTEGSEKLGEGLFADKGCISCHSENNSYNAPTVEKLGPFHDEYDFLAALWNHAPRMEELLFAKGKELPKLLPNEVKSLYLFVDAKTKNNK